MQILVPRNNADGDPSRVLVLFGSGLIGSTIAGRLLHCGWASTRQTAFLWTDAVGQAGQLDGIKAHLHHLMRRADGLGRLDIIWSAGTAGFAADWPQLLAEEATLVRVLSTLSSMACEGGVGECHFHMLSSAGGLFEGQTCVDAFSTPAPLRPYGEAKFRQEERVRNAEGVCHHIYRPTSVYGFAPKGRKGLITTLLLNMRSGRVTHVSGAASTVRDFVFATDLARHVCDRVNTVEAPSSVEILASGKPTCLAEVHSRLQAFSNHPIYLTYETMPQNSANNSYRPTAIPPSFRPTDLSIGMRQTFEAIQTHFLWEARPS